MRPQQIIQQPAAARALFAICDVYVLARQIANAGDVFGISLRDDQPFLPHCV